MKDGWELVRDHRPLKEKVVEYCASKDGRVNPRDAASALGYPYVEVLKAMTALHAEGVLPCASGCDVCDGPSS